ncbi:MAG: hypothetical protein ACTSQJ_05035 [Promethearchaeota archaeon]
MIGVILSVFDNLIGPKIFLKIPKSAKLISIDYIPLLMDLFKEGFFIHEFGDLKTANLIFNIYSPMARGRTELLMFSIISYQEQYNLNLSSFKEIMEFFVYKFRKIKDLYKGFRYKELPNACRVYKEIVDFVYSFYEFIPKDSTIIRQNFSKILVYELSPSGKDSIIKSLQSKLSKNSETFANISSTKFTEFT